MSLAGKVFAVISFILAIFYVGITSALVSLQENYKQKYVNEVDSHSRDQQSWAETQKVLDDEIGRLTKERKALNDKYTDSTAQNTILQNEWATAKDTIRFAQSIIKDQEDQIERLNGHLDRARKDLAARGTANDGLRAEIAELKAGIADMTAKRDTLQDKLLVAEKELGNLAKESVRLADELDHTSELLAKLKAIHPDIYASLLLEEVVTTKKVIRGKVTAVDAKLGLVVINAGQRQAVTKGIAFIVFRNDKYVGKIIVDEVFPDVSACRYDRDSMQMDAEVGDDVTTKLAVDL